MRQVAGEPALAPSGAVRVRIEAWERRLGKDEFRLTAPLVRPVASERARSLPAVLPELGEQAVQRVHDLHAALARANPDGVWWYLPVSEFQPVMSALPGALELEMRIASINRLGGSERYVVTVPDAYRAKYLLIRFARNANIVLCARWEDRLTWRAQRALRRVRRWTSTARWLVEHLRHWIRTRQVPDAGPLPQRSDTLFVSRFESALEGRNLAGVSWDDTYLGQLPEEGLQRTGSAVLLGRCGGDPKRLAKALATCDRFPARTVYQALKARDLFWVARRALRFRLDTSGCEAGIAPVVREESRSHVRALADCLLVERSVRRILERVRPRQIVCMQENGVWEHAVVRAAREAAPSARLIGYFHCPVMPSLFRYRTRADVRAMRPLFDRTIPLGPRMIDALKQLGDWAPLLEAGHGFRNPRLDRCFALQPAANQSPFRVLVLLGGAFDNAVFLRWLSDARIGLDGVLFEIKAHPTFPPDEEIRRAGIVIDESGRRGFALAPETAMDAALARANCAVYKGTTACVAGLAAGIPVIHVADGGISSDNTLFAAGDLSISVGTPEDFRNQILRLRDMDEELLAPWRLRARAYIREYYDLSPESKESVLTQLFPRRDATAPRGSA